MCGNPALTNHSNGGGGGGGGLPQKCSESEESIVVTVFISIEATIWSSRRILVR